MRMDPAYQRNKDVMGGMTVVITVMKQVVLQLVSFLPFYLFLCFQFSV